MNLAHANDLRQVDCLHLLFCKCSLTNVMMGFGQASVECVTLACGLFQAEKSQGQTDSRRVSPPPTQLPKKV